LFRKYSDRDLIEGIRKQDEKVLNWLYNNFLQTVRHHILKNSGSEADVADVFQETIIALYRQISEDHFTLTSDLKGYFFGIARNLWSVQLRRISRNTALDQDIADEDPQDENKDLLLERILARSFAKLQADFRQILQLFSDGLSYEEIARQMNLGSEAYARRKKYLAKEALMELVREDHEYGDYLDLR